MNLTSAPNTPIRTPQPRSSAKTLQLTPIWQEVVKNNRLPPDVDQELIFKEISVRLEDLEWPVRQHAFRVLCDIIPIIPKDRLDERVVQYNILGKLVVNLGHPAPGIRKVASETIQKYLKRTSQTEKMLEEFLQYGVREREVASNDQTGIIRENVTLGTIVTLIDVLKPFIAPENGGYSLSQVFLTETVDALAEKAKHPTYREKCLETLRKVKELVGDMRFYRCLDSLRGRDHVIELLNMNTWNSENSFNILMSQDSFDVPTENPGKEASSEDFSDGTDTETYTKEPAPNLDEDVFYHVNRAEVSHYIQPSFVPIEHSDNFLPSVEVKESQDEKDSGSSSPRVVLEAEIQFAKNKAITMKVVEDEQNAEKNDSSDQQRRFTTENGDLVMKVLENNDEINEGDKARTPRRVRFGGEVIKLRTPDSDTTDITIEIREGGDGSSRKEPTITITPDPAKSGQEESKIQIPVGLAPPKAPSREASPSRIPVLKVGCLSPKNDSFDSAPSSSGSEGGMGEKWTDDEETYWTWAELHLVEENILKDLKNKENWKIQYQALEQLKIVLINPKIIEKIGKAKNEEKVTSLLKCLLLKLPRSNNQQVTTLALSIVTQLVESLPKELLDVQDVVRGLCRYVGGCKNLNLKIEAVQCLKSLFGIVAPSAVIDVLIGEGCLLSPSSKMRENSLLAIMYALMTFPSDMFDVEKILEKVAAAVADARRRIRHAALEVIAVLSQFCSSQTLADNIARVAEGLSTSSARAQLVAAVQARLSRRLLPTISNEGLVLYALQIPASRRFGNLGHPMGADVDWILSGSGSVSTGSAKSKTQLNAAQRLEPKPSAPLSPNKWAQSERASKTLLPNKSCQEENPWKIQKHRTEFSRLKNSLQGALFYKTQSTGDLNEGELNKNFDLNFPDVIDSEKRLRPEEITWALIPVAALDEPLLGRERSNSLWGETFEENPHYISHPFGPLRPMYLKLQPTHDQFILSRSSVDVRRNSYSFGGKKKDFEDFTEIRLLTPTILREKNQTENMHQSEKFQKSEVRHPVDTPTKIPVLSTNNFKNSQKATRVLHYGSDRKISEPENALAGSQKPGRLNNAPNGFTRSPAFLPSIRTGHDSNYNVQKSPTANKFEDVDDMKPQDTMSQLSGLFSTSKSPGKAAARDFYSVKDYSEEDVNGNENFQLNGTDAFDNKIQNKFFDRSYLKNHDTLPNTIASAPPVISTDSRDQIPSTSSSNSTDIGTLSGSELRIRRLTAASGAVDDSNYRNYGTYNPKVKGKKISQTKNSNKVGINGNSFADNLKPFERPKEGLDTCLNQLESQQWEVNMLGLTSLVRLLRHHPAMVLGQLHPIIVSLGRQIRNLRSQVARVACHASGEMFLALKRNVEPDLEELSGPLFHRSADTNRFIRADCNHALDNMVDNVGFAKAVSVIISKGTTHLEWDCGAENRCCLSSFSAPRQSRQQHFADFPEVPNSARGSLINFFRHQNATVRTVAARLLLRLSERTGAEKLLSLPKENREKMLQAGANLLMEGKLETRAFAKQVFRVWSSHPSFSSLILEAVQPNVMRHISKTLISIKS